MQNTRRVVLASAVCAALLVTIGLATASYAQQGVPLPAIVAGCRGGDGPSCFLAGNIYNTGQGVVQNQRQAFQYYERSCRLGVPDGCVAAGNIANLRNRRRAHQLYRRGLRLYQTACAGGNAQACQAQAQLTATLRGM